MAVEFDRYPEIAKELQAAVAGAIAETATKIEQDVKGAAPVATPGGGGSGPRSAPYVTGNLRRSYHQDRSNLADPVEPSIDVGSDPGIAEYAIYVEFGTYKMQPRPHLTPSSESERGNHEVRVAAAVAEVMAGGGVGSFAAPTAMFDALGNTGDSYLGDY